MTEVNQVPIHCETCQKSFDYTIYQNVNVTETPELKEKFKNAAEHSLLISERVLDVFKEIGIKKSVDDYSSKLREKPFTSQFYLTVPGKGYYIMTYVVEVVILIITFFSVKSVIKNIRKNKAEYEELFIK